MFVECHSLRKAPSILPATQVPAYTYMGMFELCRSLEASPVLPAQTPGYRAYSYMFYRCYSLKQITCYARSNIGEDGATHYWVAYAPSTGIFIKDPDASWPTGIHGIPSGWNDDNPDPLTIEAIEDGTITITNPQGLTIRYSKSASLSASSSSSLATINIPLNAGEKLRLWGDNAVYGGTAGASYLDTHISGSNPYYAYGDIRSLLSSSDFTTVTTLQPYAFHALFAGQTFDGDGNPILNPMRMHPEMELTLGATTLGTNCCEEMFARTAITSAPVIPATTLAEGCFSAMFSGCTALVNAPSLPATTLARNCYANMFDFCTSLVNAPVLNAATLVQGCYSYMFRDCSSLASVKCLATNPVLSDYEVEPYIEGNVDDWLENTAASGTFTKKNGVAWPSGSIPDGWSVVNQ